MLSMNMLTSSMQKESSVQCLGLVDFAIGLLNFILNLTDVRVQFF